MSGTRFLPHNQVRVLTVAAVSYDFWVAAERRHHDDPANHFLTYVTLRHVGAHTEMRSALGCPAIADVALRCSTEAAASTSSSSDLTTSHLWTNEVMQFEAERGRRYAAMESRSACVPYCMKGDRAMNKAMSQVSTCDVQYCTLLVASLSATASFL